MSPKKFFLAAVHVIVQKGQKSCQKAPGLWILKQQKHQNCTSVKDMMNMTSTL